MEQAWEYAARVWSGEQLVAKVSGLPFWGSLSCAPNADSMVMAHSDNLLVDATAELRGLESGVYAHSGAYIKCRYREHDIRHSYKKGKLTPLEQRQRRLEVIIGLSVFS